MNVIDNGIKEVIEVKRVITPEELYFEVQYIDYYNHPGKKRFMSIKNLENKNWVE
jgi:hypothetical protein